MNIRLRPIHPSLIAALLSSVALPALAQEPDIPAEDMLEIGSAEETLGSTAYDVSADGSTVTGTANVTMEVDGRTSTYSQAFRWSVDGGQPLGTLRTGDIGYSRVHGSSANGTVLVGETNVEPAEGASRVDTQAFRWTEDEGMRSLGTLRTDGSGWSYARDVSGDGAVVVGSAETDDGAQQAFRWTSDGIESLGTFLGDGSGTSYASAVSTDGSTIVGNAEILPPGAEYTGHQAFRWTEDGMVHLGTLRADGTGYSDAVAVSADGSVAAGRSATDSGTTQAVRWTDEGMQGLGTLRSDDTGSSYAEALSADGSTVVGSSDIESDMSFHYTHRAFRWTDATGMEDLGTLRDDGQGSSTATAVSADGSVVVGGAEMAMEVDDSPVHYQRAFRWTAADGMVDLGTLKADNTGYSYAWDVSDDGTVVVGQADSDSGGTRAFIYRARAAEPDPVDPAPAEPEPAPEEPAPVDPAPAEPDPEPTPVEPTPVTPEPEPQPEPANPAPEPEPEPANPAPEPEPAPADPAPVEPTPSRPVPTPPDTMLDLENTQESIVRSARQQSVSTQARNTVLLDRLGAELDLSSMVRPDAGLRISTKGSGSLPSRRPLALRLDGAFRTGGDAEDMSVAGFSAAVGATPDLTFGGFLHQGFTSEGDVLSVGTSLRSRRVDGTGPTWRGAVGYSRGDVSFLRDDALSNTEAVDGESRVETMAASVELGYGIDSGRTLFTPFLRLSHSVTTRDGYTEEEADFPVTYESYDASTTALTVGVTGRRPISETSLLRFGAGVDVDLDRSDDPIRGSSEVPGLRDIELETPSLENEVRPYARLGLSQSLSGGSVVTLDIGTQASAYSSEPRSFVAVGYQIRF